MTTASSSSIKAPTLYRLVLLALTPLVFIYTVYRSFKDGKFIYFLQRLGLCLPDLKSVLWFHCASVGEVNTAISLIQKFREKHPTLPILVSTNTPTGKEVLLKYKIDHLSHIYLPLDYLPLIRRLIRKLNPIALLIIDTELWPELIHTCEIKNLPVIIYNARLSDKTLYPVRWLRCTYKNALLSLTCIFTKSALDKARFIQLGAKRDCVSTIGSLKFAKPASQHRSETINLKREFWLAASTHEDEEFRICTAWRASGRGELLVIAPRHPERRRQLLSQLQTNGNSVQLRSEQKELSLHTEIYIADTLGEMRGFMSAATVVFVGGSLIPRGGHNTIEPAQLGSVIITGPSTTNFSEETEILLKRGAIIQVKDENELIRQLISLLDDSKKRRLMSKAAKLICDEYSSIVNDYYHQIASQLDNL